MKDPVPEVDFAAAKVLYQLHDPEGVQFLLDVVSKESKASSGFITKEKRGALRMLHTPTQLFTTIAIEAAGFAPYRGWGSAYPRLRASCRRRILPLEPRLCC